MHKVTILLWVFIFLQSCSESENKNKVSNSETISSISDTLDGNFTSTESKIKSKIDLKRQLIKLSHHINTSANEYLPVISKDEDKIYFSAMDRSGFFDFKVDFISQASSGGEDIFLSIIKDGIWTDARPITNLNTNGHEVVSQVLDNGSLVLAANYTEKLGSNEAGVETTDLFIAQERGVNNFQIFHFPEPVNSIFSECDGFISSDGSYILFVSDRPGHVGDYHKKGWKWNSSFWGNTDVYVSLKNDDFWSVPINLGDVINTKAAERTPWLSDDGLTLYVSSNGYYADRTDLDIYAFKRKNKSNWTEWEGPYPISDANSLYDDWGYKETESSEAYFARVVPLGFKPTQGGTAGDGGIRETNYRTGYEIFGQQIAALNSENTTDIYYLKKHDAPIITLTDMIFDFNSSTIKPALYNVLDRLIDLILQNNSYTLEIQGHTDDTGDEGFNLSLSKKRADSVKEYLRQNNIQSDIITIGFGESKPKFDNSSSSNKAKNRRVEVLFKNK